MPEGVGPRAFTVAMFLSQGAVVAVVGLLLVTAGTDRAEALLGIR